MTHLLSLVLWNAGLAALFAFVIFLAQRIKSLKFHPSLWHTLWLLVVVKLVTPPLFTVPLADTYFAAAETAAPEEVTLDNAVLLELEADENVALSPLVEWVEVADVNTAVVPPPAAPKQWNPESWIAAAVAVSASVTIALLLISFSRIRSIGRLVRCAKNGPEWLQSEAEQTARRLGLQCRPSVRVIETGMTPFLWASRSGPVVVVPAGLVQALDKESLGLIVTHELAHYSRRDHWTGSVVMLVGTLMWWNPVFWWARRELRLVQELCCDAIVLSTDSGRRRRYAETLLAAVEFVADNHRTLPTPAPAFGSCSTFRRRIEMICRSDISAGPSRVTRLVIGAVGVLLIAATPAFADHDEDHDRSSEQLERLRAEMREVNERLMKLDRLVDRLLDERGGDREHSERREVRRVERDRDHRPHPEHRDHDRPHADHDDDRSHAKDVARRAVEAARANAFRWFSDDGNRMMRLEFSDDKDGNADRDELSKAIQEKVRKAIAEKMEQSKAQQKRMVAELREQEQALKEAAKDGNEQVARELEANVKALAERLKAAEQERNIEIEEEIVQEGDNAKQIRLRVMARAKQEGDTDDNPSPERQIIERVREAVRGLDRGRESHTEDIHVEHHDGEHGEQRREIRVEVRRRGDNDEQAERREREERREHEVRVERREHDERMERRERDERDRELEQLRRMVKELSAELSQLRKKDKD